MPYRYDVRHAFAHGGRWYTRRNAAEVAELPRKVRDPLISQGKLVEHHVPADSEESAGDPEPEES